ncbi:DUF1080 domain-containing protein [Saccharobesus litoralis]|uniref:DUF1080 domain-containing protein n=1 Tax=Saccharobesus litoralis TaxID=2172099 RepID=A0A2S0VNI1_9ALTE|nr:DUF1080 domain-containing protein [Saccharobesus litoralis]AWB65781.1 DUF1080 domain-containing protein [Saccharobesus litoralis]
MKKTNLTLFSCILALGLTACSQNDTTAVTAGTTEQWQPLFNGEDLSNWTVKFAGFPVGENYKNTFRVENGLLSVNFDQHESFNGEFGHLFTNQSFSHYRLRATYRFVGEQLKKSDDYRQGIGWAYRNNGFMLHSQDPKTMELDQSFPASIEAQLLGGDGTNQRNTLNVCTPDSHVVINNKLVKDHCIKSVSKTYHGDQWVDVEIEVRGSEVIRHIIDGEVVFEYGQIQLDEKSLDKYKTMYGGKMMSAGHIAIQAETHPTQFKRIDILPLDPKA